MRRLMVGLLALGLTGAVLNAQDQPKVEALPPHPLDGAFQRGNTPNDLTNGLLNNEAFKNAVRAALKAKMDQEAKYRETKNYVGSTPAQAARQAFLAALNEPTKDQGKGGGK